MRYQSFTAVLATDMAAPVTTLHGHRLEVVPKDDKIKVMKQTKSLQGTSVWISDELTLIQLKNRAKELAKVREARKEGKWAVYRGGKAIIRDFKNPPPPSKTWT